MLRSFAPALRTAVRAPGRSQALLLQPFRCMAGHSKWANIRHKKGKNDAARMKVFTKLSSAIAKAVRSGKSSNPDENHTLRAAIARAKAGNLPKDRIQAAIKQGDSPGGDYALFEVKGAGNAGILVELETDNTSRARLEINTAVKKTSASVVPAGKVSNLFERKGVFQLPTTVIEEDELFELVAEAGAEDVETVAMPEPADGSTPVSEEAYEITTTFRDYAAVSKALDASPVAEHVMEEFSGLLYLPLEHGFVEVDEEAYEENLETISRIEEIPDVTNVFHNMVLSE